MSAPELWNYPEEHYPMPVNADGNGPAEGDDVVALVCACGLGDCLVFALQTKLTAAQARAAAAEAAVRDYEQRICWDTTCAGCASVLDASYASYVRAEQAEERHTQLATLHAACTPTGPSAQDVATMNRRLAADGWTRANPDSSGSALWQRGDVEVLVPGDPHANDAALRWAELVAGLTAAAGQGPPPHRAF